MDDVYNRCLLNIENTVLSLGGQKFEDYRGLPEPKTYSRDIINCMAETFESKNNCKMLMIQERFKYLIIIGYFR